MVFCCFRSYNVYWLANIQLHVKVHSSQSWLKTPSKLKYKEIRTWITVFEPTKSSIFFQSRSNLKNPYKRQIRVKNKKIHEKSHVFFQKVQTANKADPEIISKWVKRANKRKITLPNTKREAVYKGIGEVVASTLQLFNGNSIKEP